MARPEDPQRGRGVSRRRALATGGAAALAGAVTAPHSAAAAAEPCQAPATRIAVSADHVVGSLPKFWRCTGFTPAELLLLPEMRQMLSFLGAIPNRGIEFVRVHFLLDLIRATRLPSGIAYEWSLFDEALDTMLERGLRPFFELMGNPSGLFEDFEDLDQLVAWRDLVTELASRCVARYGRAEVREWWFETWNEPDLPFWPWSERGFLNYVDACRVGLDEVDPGFRFGGPGTAATLSPAFRAFLAHCDHGTNVLTGEAGVRLDFISVHEKASREHESDLTPRPLAVIERERRAVDHIRAHHPRLAILPFINNECDPEVGWLVPHTYRALPYYAALMAKMIDQRRRLMIEGAGVDCPLMSNDNGFIGRFPHRSHLAYFGRRRITQAQAEHRTDLEAVHTARATSVPFELVKKPALAVTEMLALLGRERCAVEAALDPDQDGLGVLATRAGGAERIAILLYNSVDRIRTSGERRVLMELTGLPAGAYSIATLRLDEANGCAFNIWDAWQAPDLPSAEQLALMRGAGEPSLEVEERTVSAASLSLELSVLLPSVTLVLVETSSGRAPSPPAGLRAEPQPGLTERESMLITWRPGPHAGAQLFEVLFARGAAGSFERLSPAPLISAAFLHAREPGSGRYVVEARSLGGATARSDPIQA
jgi:L-iduronidase